MLWILLAVASVNAAFANHPQMQPGDVIAGGSHFWCLSAPPPVRTDWFHPDGSLNRMLGGLEARGIAINPAGEIFVVSPFGIFVFNASGNLVRRFSDVTSVSAIVFDRMGNAFIALEGISPRIRKLDVSGNLLDEWSVPSVGLTGLDLAVDQCTMFVVGRSPVVTRFDVCRGVPLPPLTGTLPEPDATGIRILQDGTLLVTQHQAIHRLSGSGSVIRSYDIPEVDGWLAVAVDPDENTIWASAANPLHPSLGPCYGYRTNIYQLDLMTGAHLATGPINGYEPPSTPYYPTGLAIFGEPRAATGAVAVPTLSQWALILLGLALAAVAFATIR